MYHHNECADVGWVNATTCAIPKLLT